MKFTILKTSLLNALNTVSKAISNKNPNAILTGVKLELNELGLTLIGTDTDISISTFIENIRNKIMTNNIKHIILFFALTFFENI